MFARYPDSLLILATMHILRTFDSLIPAQLAQARLRSTGIESVIPEEISATAGYSGVVGGVRLQVNERDREAAEAVLRELEEGSPAK